MDWSQALAIIAANIVLFFWLRTESNADRRQIQVETSADRRDFLHLIREIKDELKEFHTKLAVQDSEFKNHIMYHNKEDKNRRH